MELVYWSNQSGQVRDPASCSSISGEEETPEMDLEVATLRLSHIDVVECCIRETASLNKYLEYFKYLDNKGDIWMKM